MFWQVSITDHGWALLPIALKSNIPRGKISGSNTANGEAYRCWSQTLLPHIKEKVVLLRCDETMELHIAKQQPKEKAGGGEKTKEERWQD